MLSLSGVTKEFVRGGGQKVLALDNVSLSVRTGEFVVLLGHNGSGKSTLFNLISGRLLPDNGKIFVGGHDITTLAEFKRSKYVTRIHQARDSAIPASMTVGEVLRVAIESGIRRRLSGRAIKAYAIERLEATRKGLYVLWGQQIWNLSGGEQQLVNLVLATILADHGMRDSHLLLFDEHTSQLDPEAQDVVMSATEELVAKRQIPTIMATHNYELATRFGSRQLVLSRGSLVADVGGDNFISCPDRLRQLVESAGDPVLKHGSEKKLNAG